MIQIQNGLTFDCYYFVVVVIILFVKILKMIKYDPLLLSERKKSVLIIHIVLMILVSVKLRSFVQ